MAARKPTVRSNKFERIGEVGLDARKRVSLVRRGLKQLAGGKRYNLGTFEEFLDDEID